MKSVSREEALKKGTKILAETLVYGISVSILIYEYRKSQIKENDRIEEMAQLQTEIRVLKEKTENGTNNLRSKMVKKDENVLDDVDRNYPDRPFVRFLVFLFVRLILLYICSVY